MKALILKDLQNDFLASGAVPIEGTEELIKTANEVMDKFDVVIAIQKWFPADHHSFAANHPWRKPGQEIEIEGKMVTLDIIHCVADSFGAAFSSALEVEKIDYVIKNHGQDGDLIIAEINEIVKKHEVSAIEILGKEEDEEES